MKFDFVKEKNFRRKTLADTFDTPSCPSLIWYEKTFSLSFCFFKKKQQQQAGSERAKRTNNTGNRLMEGASINQSLSTLKRCFEGLRHNQIYGSTRPQAPVPFRESKLTRLFQVIAKEKKEGKKSIYVFHRTFFVELEEHP